MSPNKLAAPNPAIVSQLHVRRYWRRIGEPECWPLRIYENKDHAAIGELTRSTYESETL